MVQEKTFWSNQGYVLTDAIAAARLGRAKASPKTIIQATIRVDIPANDGLYYCPTEGLGLRETSHIYGELGNVVPEEVRLLNGDKVEISPGRYDVPVMITMNGTTDVELAEDTSLWQRVTA